MPDLLLFLAPRGSPPPLVQLGYDLTLLAKVERAAIESWESEQEQIRQRRREQLAHANFIRKRLGGDPPESRRAEFSRKKEREEKEERG